jgi:hypothetical protein
MVSDQQDVVKRLVPNQVHTRSSSPGPTHRRG